MEEEKKKGLSSSHKARVAGGRPRGNSGWGEMAKYLPRIFLAVGILAGVGILGFYLYQFLKSAGPNSPQAVLIKFQEKKNPVLLTKSSPDALVLSAQEKEDLYRQMTVQADRDPDSAEQKILSHAAQFQTGGTENLPSVAWTLSQYQTMIADQERFYKMPFARSYKNKLTDLFKTKYLAAADAFTKGDILMARNFWVESLAFHLYSTDLRKHRAVALTMLRPFINDTLAKIRVMNQILSDQSLRLEEKSLTAEYQNLLSLIGQKKWPEALTAIETLTTQMMTLQQRAKQPNPLPAYPSTFAMIDQDLKPVLLELMTVNPSTLADLQSLQQDLVEKKEVLETYTKAYVDHVTGIYHNALELIRQEKWQEAMKQLETIPGPRVLQEDAARKVAILRKKITSVASEEV